MLGRQNGPPQVATTIEGPEAATTIEAPQASTTIDDHAAHTVGTFSVRPTGTASPSASSTSDSSQPKWMISAIVPVVIIVVTLVIIGILYRFRKPVKEYFSSFSNSTHAFQPVGSGSTRTLTAEELATSGRSRAGTNATGSSTVNSGSPLTTVSGNAAQGRNRPARRSYRRNLRRTESGQSVKTLPEYRKEAGDQELVLVPQRSSSIISEEDASASENEGEYGQIDDIPLEDENNVARSDSRRSVRSASGSQDVTLQLPNNADTETHSAPSGSGPGAALSRVRDSLSRRGWGEAPTYLEAMSSPFFSSSNSNAELGGVPAPKTNLRERTTSGFRGLLSRAGLAPSAFHGTGGRPMTQRPSSQASLLLQPTTSRMSTLTSGTVTSPWASTNSLLISSPLPNSAMRASFEIPRAGLSDDQMRFLSSSEAVNLAGTRLDEPPAWKKRRRASSAATTGLLGTPEAEGEAGGPLPSWDELDQERRMTEAAQRRDLSRPVQRDSERAEEGTAAVADGDMVAATRDGEGDVSGTKPASRPELSIPLPLSAASGPELEVVPPTPVTATSGVTIR
ncbi:hypothetical protein BCR39DRAFT_507514 [Naematelia encephala]|uniref:Uncharacterized protein n=1 Tax=Naematelia encephala TaxID=71784 RepID=A0A1Y2ANZ6_9TREE|nr:hypothetical protein BCR39DRAFT_507514 [Naematelia encephala]